VSDASVALRPATVADAESLARCHLACWREAYTGMVDPARLAQALGEVAARIERWRSILATAPGTLLAVEGDRLVGFAAAGPNRDPDVDLSTELYALYARRAHWGRGVGHRLLQATVGEEDSLLWVFRDNLRARRFYLAHGYRPDGTEKLEERLGGVEIRMVRRGAASGGC